MDRIYLDNAATSWPKPESVYTAVDHALRVNGAAAGRGGYQQVIDSMRMVEHTRGLVAKLINAPSHKNLAFTFNGTDSLSTAIFGLLKPGDHVVTSVVEHNSVLRPLKYLEANSDISLTIVGCDQTARINEDEIAASIKPNTRLVVLNHVSNVTGTIQPIENVKSVIQSSKCKNAVFLLDAAQSLGHIPIDVQAIGCDILAAPGHKGLLGPLGTGILYVTEEVTHSIAPLRYGGTGSDGSREFQPTEMPDRFEAGNLNVSGIAGVGAGIKFLQSDCGLAAHDHRHRLSARLLKGLHEISGISLQGPQSMDDRLGVFSLSIGGFDCHEAASILDSNWMIQTRSGLHCAPLIHRTLGSESEHGTIRLSVGLFNTIAQIEETLVALEQLAAQSSTDS